MSSEVYAAIGTAIRTHRAAIGMSQAALAHHAGLSRTSITNIENGGQAILVHQLLALARGLGVPPEKLLPRLRAPEQATDHESDVPDEFKALLAMLDAKPSRSRRR